MKTKKVGRPRVPAQRVVTIRVPEDVAVLYDAEAARRKLSHPTQVYREAVIDAAERFEDSLETATNGAKE